MMSSSSGASWHGCAEGSTAGSARPSAYVCYMAIPGLKPQARMGLTRPQIEKLMDGATKKIGGIVASIEARGCGGEEWARLMRAYALGSLATEDRDYSRAAAHAESCDACRRYVRGLQGLSAILPPLGVSLHLASARHASGILSHLKGLLRSHGAGSSLQATSAGSASAAGGAGGAALGSLGSGAVIKGVAVVAGVAAVGLAASGHSPRHHSVHHVSAQARPAPRPARASARSSVAVIEAQTPVHQTTSLDRFAPRPSPLISAQTQVSREFGIENRSPPRVSPRPHGEEFASVASQAATRQAATSQPTAPSSTVAHEFGFEH